MGNWVEVGGGVCGWVGGGLAGAVSWWLVAWKATGRAGGVPALLPAPACVQMWGGPPLTHLMFNVALALTLQSPCRPSQSGPPPLCHSNPV